MRTLVFFLVLTMLATVLGIAPSHAVSIEQGQVVSANPVDFTPRVIDGEVRAITQVGDRVFVGGTFTQVRQVSGNILFTRTNIFAYNRLTGLIDTGFVPSLSGGVDALAAAPGGTAVFVGGNFAQVNGVNNYGVTKLTATDGQRVAGFTATTSGRVRDLKVHGNKVYLAGDLWAINGVSRNRLGAVDATTGVLDTTLTIGPTLPRVNNTWIQKIDISPDGSRLAIIGNFLAVGGVDRKQLALIDLTTSPASLANWSTEGYSPACASVFWTYMRDIEFSPDGSYFAIVTTGGPNGTTLCDTTARWNPALSGTGLTEEWANWTGGDTLWSVAVTDVAVYIGGHQRWVNNHLGRDSAGAGAVSREGIAALDPINGVPLTWNPGKDRGVGVFDIYLTADGVHIGSDTDNVAGEWHPKIAMFPLSGGTVPPTPTPIGLPADLYWGSSTANTLSVASYDGTTFGPTSTVSHPFTWSSVRSAFWEAGKLYYVVGGSMYSRTWDGTTFGPEVNLNTWPSWSSVTAMDWDGGKLYYTDSSSNLFYRYFSLESGIVGSQTFTISTSSDGASWSTTAGMFITGNHLYQARTNGNLWRWDLVNADIVPGTGVMLASSGWNVQDLFLADFDQEPDLPPTVDLTAPAANASVSGTTVTVSATAADDLGVNRVEFFANGTSIGIDTNSANGWSANWDSTGAADGPVTLTAAATDTGNQTTTSAPRSVTVDNNGPTVTVSAPAPNTTVSGNAVTVSATATDTVGVAQVEFFAGGSSIGVDTNAAGGWSVTWDTTTVANGTVNLTATATDTGGRTATSASVPVTVDNGGTPAGPVVMVVANPAALHASETLVRDRLQTMGFTVTVVDDTGVTSAAATGASFVLVSFTVANSVGTVFRDVTVPVWMAKTFLFDDMEMTGPTAGTHYDNRSFATMTITAAGHPMAAGRTGTVTYLTAATSQPWAVPVAGATTVATNGTEAVSFVIPTGTTLDNGQPAAGCRLTYPVFQQGPQRYTTDGWAMFEATATYAAGGCGVTPPPPPPASEERVIVISIDGFNPEALDLTATPNLDRVIDEGVSTLNARTVLESTQTLPNHLSMVAGIPVTETGGHGVTFNEDDGGTVHATAGRYVPSMFDVAHDNGMSTLLYAGKPKFDFMDRSWDGTNGALDTTGVDNGRDKIDVYARGDGADMTTQFLSQLDTAPPNLSMIHYAALDGTAHEHGFLSAEYLADLVEVDGLIGDILDAVEDDPALEDTTVIITTDHGGTGFEHATASDPVNYTIPLFVWGAGVSEGVDLYAINGGTRLDPGTDRPTYAGTQPIRNAEVANLALDLLDLNAVSGSTINDAQDLVVNGTPPANVAPSVSLSAPAAGATVSGASVTVSANASDSDGTVTQVEFFADATSIGVDTNGVDGWSVTWDTSTVTDGDVSLTATATDDDTATTTTAPRTVTVDNNGTPTGPVVMVVANPAALHASETLVRDRLQTMGFTVTVVDDTGVTSAAATGASFVLVSFTVANSVGTVFRDVTVPVWMAKTFLFDDMEMTGPTAGTHYDNRSFATMTITAAGHPMAAGRTGTVTYLTAATSQPWAVPVAGATTVATNGTEAVSFVIPTGTTLDNGQPAAGCRLTYPVFQQGPQRYTTDGWAMFEATATYAANGCS